MHFFQEVYVVRKNFGDLPIDLKTLPWTGLEDGDDGKSELSPGYRNVRVLRIPDVEQDPIVEVNATIPRHAVYARGARRKVCSVYGTGLGAPSAMLIR